MTTRKNMDRPAPEPFPVRTPPIGERIHGKITRGTVTLEMVEQRARELAEIDGRGPEQTTQSDRDEAKRELLGAVHPNLRDQEEEEVAAGDWTSPPADTGKRAPKMLPQDDQMREELVEEGIDEAEHDQMRQAARRQRKES